MTTRTSRRTKPTAATAHVGYQRADPAAPARNRRDRYHAVADQIVTLGPLIRQPGHALCGVTGPWPEPPAGLFPPLVTCPACRALADTNRIILPDQQ